MRPYAMLVALGVCLAHAAYAQDFEAAGKHFNAARAAFDAKHYATAAAEFQRAYDIVKDPLLLYNVAESAQRGGEGRAAVTAYKAYLRAQPKALDRAEVERRIKKILASHYKVPNQSAPGDEPPMMAEKPPALPAPPPIPPTPPVVVEVKPAPPAVVEVKPAPPVPPIAEQPMAPTFLEQPAAPPATDRPVTAGGSGRGMTIAGGVLLGLGVGLAATGIAFGVRAGQAADDLIAASKAGVPWDAAKERDGRRDNTLFIALVSAGPVVAVTGAILLGLGVRKSRAKNVAVLPTVGPGGAGLTLRTGF